MARKRKQQQEQQQRSLVSAEDETLRNPPRFGGFYDKDGYNGKPPSRAVLRSAWDAVWDKQKGFLRRSAQLTGGQIWSVDETFKVMKGVRVDDQKVFNGLFTVMNEYNQVIGQVSACARVAAASWRCCDHSGWQ